MNTFLPSCETTSFWGKRLKFVARSKLLCPNITHQTHSWGDEDLCFFATEFKGSDNTSSVPTEFMPTFTLIRFVACSKLLYPDITPQPHKTCNLHAVVSHFFDAIFLSTNFSVFPSINFSEAGVLLTDPPDSDPLDPAWRNGLFVPAHETQCDYLDGGSKTIDWSLRHQDSWEIRILLSKFACLSHSCRSLTKTDSRDLMPMAKHTGRMLQELIFARLIQRLLGDQIFTGPEDKGKV